MLVVIGLCYAMCWLVWVWNLGVYRGVGIAGDTFGGRKCKVNARGGVVSLILI